MNMSMLFLNHVILKKTKVRLPQAKETLADFLYHVEVLWFYYLQNF